MSANEPEKVSSINISAQTMIKFFLVALLGVFIYLIRDILGVVFAAMIFSAALSPLVDYLGRKHVPRWLSVTFVYILVLSAASLVVVLMVPPISHEIQSISQNFPVYYDRVMSLLSDWHVYSGQSDVVSNVQSVLSTIEKQLNLSTGAFFSTAKDFFSSLISLVVMLVIMFYMLVEENGLRRLIQSIAPSQYQPYLVQLLNRIQRRLGWWLRGQLILSLIIGVLVYIGLAILGVRYALVLSIIAGLLEFIPFLGPILASIPAVFLTFTSTQSVAYAIIAFVLFWVIQFLENHLIVPKVMQHSVGLHPVVVIVAMLIGGRLAGIVGVILAVPVTIILSSITGDIFANRQQEEIETE